MLRAFQYLRAPNAIHDAHRLGHAAVVHAHPSGVPTLRRRRRYAAALHRLRLEDRLDAAVAPVLAFARLLDKGDRWWRRVPPEQS